MAWGSGSFGATGSAGESAANPVLNGLGGQWVFGASSADIASFVDAWLDQAATMPGTTSVKGSVSPASTVITAGTNASWTNATSTLTISSTTGLSAGDYLYLNHGSITPGIYQIQSVTNSTQLVLTSSINASNLTNITFQVHWRYSFTFGSAPTQSSAGGTQNYFKFRAQDGTANQSDQVESAYIRNAPAGASYISLSGNAYDANATVNTTNLTLAILAGWSSRGGVSHVALANHSVQAVNNFQWADSSTGEKPLAYATTAGNLRITGADGQKYGRLLLRAKSASSTQVGVDFSLVLDATGPALQMFLFGN